MSDIIGSIRISLPRGIVERSIGLVYDMGSSDVMRRAGDGIEIMRRSNDRIRMHPNKNSQIFNMINNYLPAYIERGEKPPEEISHVILNLADELSTGKDLNIRLGDYLTMINYIKKHEH